MSYQSELRFLHSSLGSWRGVETRLGLSHATQGKTIRRWLTPTNAADHRTPGKTTQAKIHHQYLLAQRRQRARANRLWLRIRPRIPDDEEVGEISRAEWTQLSHDTREWNMLRLANELEQIGIEQADRQGKGQRAYIDYQIRLGEHEPSVQGGWQSVAATTISSRNLLLMLLQVRQSVDPDSYDLIYGTIMRDMEAYHPRIAATVKGMT